VARAIVQEKTRIIDIDLRSYFDNVRHDRLLAKVALRVDDADVLHLLKLMLKANGRRGVPQGGVISPLLSNLYLNEVDKMLNGIAAEAQGHVPPLPIATSEPGCAIDQPGAARLGELLRGRAFQRVL
jgi:hypothetical protein